MIERALVEYLANALWQIPLLAGGAWLALVAAKAGPRMQYGVWLGVLGLAVVLPVRGMGVAGRIGGQEGVGSRLSADAEIGVAPVLDPGFVPASDQGGDPALRTQEAGLMRERLAATIGAAGRDWLAIAPRVRQVDLSERAVNWLVGSFGVTVLFGLLRVVRAWQAARRLVEESRETGVGASALRYLEGYGERLGVALPEIRESGAVSSPMIVGLVGPVLLLPEGFTGHSEDEVRAALCHELAHVKRRDYLVNLVCQVVAVPVGWHPVTYAVQQRIRRTREMVCDAMAAREMSSEISYARCLLAMAQSMLGGTSEVALSEGIGLFGNNSLEERVMRLMETKTAMSVRAKMARAASGVGMLAVATAVAAMFHVVPTMAAAKNTAVVAQSSPVVAVGAISPEVAPEVTVTPVVVDGLAERAAVPQAVPAPEPVEPTVVLPVPPVAPAPPVLPAVVPEPPVPAATPLPPAAPVAPVPPGGGKGVHVHRALTPEEKSQMDRAVAEVRAKINSPEFKEQIAKAQKEAAEAAAKVNSPEFRRQMEEAAKKGAEAKAFLSSSEFKKQMEDAAKAGAAAKDYVNSPTFKLQMDQMRKQQEELKKMDMRKMQQQLQKEMAHFNSAELQEQMKELQKMVQSGEVQRNIDEEMKKFNETMSRSLVDPAK